MGKKIFSWSSRSHYKKISHSYVLYWFYAGMGLLSWKYDTADTTIYCLLWDDFNVFQQLKETKQNIWAVD